MFNMGFTELLFLSVLALIFIGPKQLPEVARTVGRLINEFKRATSEVTSSLSRPTYEEFKPIEPPAHIPGAQADPHLAHNSGEAFPHSDYPQSHDHLHDHIHAHDPHHDPHISGQSNQGSEEKSSNGTDETSSGKSGSGEKPS